MSAPKGYDHFSCADGTFTHYIPLAVPMAFAHANRESDLGMTTLNC